MLSNAWVADTMRGERAPMILGDGSHTVGFAYIGEPMSASRSSTSGRRAGFEVELEEDLGGRVDLGRRARRIAASCALGRP